jgi:hypothetical protein
MGTVTNAVHREPWNKRARSSVRRHPSLKDICAPRCFQMENRVREFIFNLGIDSSFAAVIS